MTTANVHTEEFPELSENDNAVYVCGSPEYPTSLPNFHPQQEDKPDKAIQRVLDEFGIEPDVLVCGGRTGVESAARHWGILNSVPIALFDASVRGTLSEHYIYNTNGEIIYEELFARNKEIINHADQLVAIWSGNCDFTEHAITVAQEELGVENVHVWVYR